MIVYPNAKINIGLNIISKRQNGFHNIESCFVPIGLSDILEIIPSDSKTSFQSSGIEIPGNSNNNLCIQAWEILNKDFNIPNVKMHLHKQVPIGAGLGGGSADGAFALKAFAELFNLKLSVKQLENYASNMGSDCTFFIQNQTAFVEGVGEQLSQIDLNLSHYQLVLINPGIHISTQEAYAGIKPTTPKDSLILLIKEPINTWQGNIYNDFEAEIFKNHPEIEKIKAQLIELGAVYASMSGSGSTVFGLFEKSQVIDLKDRFNNMFIWQGSFT